MQNDQTREYLRHTYRYADLYSDDPKTKIGAILIGVNGGVIGIGANAFPRDVVGSSDRLERPKKYSFIEHAERNSIFNACRNGKTTTGATLYCPWFACADCARAIIQAGIVRVVGHEQMFTHAGEYHWGETIAHGNEMLSEAGVETFLYNGPIGNVTNLFNGENWKP